MSKFPPENTQASEQPESITAQALRQAHFDAFFAAANVGLLILDRQLRYVQINEALAEINGPPVADHIGRPLSEVLPEFAPTLVPMLQSILDTGKPILDYEIVGERPKQPGIVRYWQTSYYPLVDGNGLVFGVGGIVIEITDRKRTEKEQARLTAILEATSDLVGVADATGHNVYLNKAGQKMLGIPSEEARSPFSLDFVLSPSAIAKFHNEVFPTALRGGSWAGETVFLSRDGREIPVSQVLIVHKTEAGEVEFVSTIARDISDRKKAEEERQLLATAIENSRDFIGVASMEGRPILVNQAGLDLVGLSSLEEARTKHITDFFMPEDLHFVQQRILPVLMQEGGWRSDYRFRHFVTAKPIPLDYTLFLVKDPQTNEPIGIATVSRDISDRKKTEEALKQSEERFRSLIETSAQIIWTTNAEGEFVTEQPGWTAFTGQPYDECKGWGWLNFIHPDDRSYIGTAWLTAVTNRSIYEVEFRMRRHDGEYRYMTCRAVPILQADGTIREWVGANTDITERKQAEDALREQQAALRDRNALLNSILESTPDFTVVKDRQGRYVVLNSNAATFIGKPIEEIIGKDDLEILPPEIAREIMAKDRQIMRSGTAGAYEEDIGSTTFLTTKAPWRDANGNVLGIVATSRDISDRKATERALQYNEERFRSLTEATSQLIWTTNSDGELVTGHHLWKTFTGQSFEELQGWGWLDAIHPDDKPYVTKVSLEALANKTILQVEYRLRHHSGEYRYMSVRAVPLLNADGSIREWFGVHTDITDRKLAEAALAESEERFRCLVEGATGLIWSSTLDGTLTYVSPQFREMSGYETAEFLGRSFAPLVHPQYLTSCYEFLEEVVKTGEKRNGFEFPYIRKDGSWFWANSNISPIVDITDRVVGFQGIIEDITDRKLAEDSLKLSEERYRSLIAATSQIVWATDAEGRGTDLRSWRAYTGQTEAEVLDLGWLEPIYPDDRERTSQVWMAAVQTKSLFDIEYRIRGTDGNYRYFQGRGVPIVDENGHIREWVGTCNDIHDRKLAEDSLKLSEERYRSLITATSQLVWTADAEGRCVDQPGWRAYTGQTEAEMADGFGWLDAIHPDDRERTAQVWMEAVQSKNLYDTEYRIRGADGNYRYFQLRGIPIVDEDGSIREWIGTCTDIHDRKLAEDSLKLSEERYRSLITATSQIVWMGDAEGRCPDIPTLRAYTGQTVEEVVGFGWLDAFHPDDREQTAQVWMEAVQNKSLYDIEYRIRGADGNYRYFQGRAVPILNEDGSLREWVGTCTDIHDRKLAEMALAKAKDAAEAASRAKSEFLANMSHELRTPLNGIMGYAQILQRSKHLKEEERSRIDVIYQCGSHLLTLINDILDLSKIEAQKVELTPTDFHFPAFLQGVAEMCRIRAELKGIHFQFQSTSELPIGIRADEKRLRQVLINLLSNAIKFTDKGSVTFTVSFGTAEGNIRFEVRDTGIGIPREQLQAIFEPFEQAGDRRRQTEGTGLGLAISQRIVELMSSTIEVQSELNVGSIFWFDVNLPPADEWVKTSQADDRGQIIGIESRQPKILVVDDKWANRSVITNLLSPIGFEVSEAVDGQEGWQKIQAFQPDLVVTDLLMPEVDGFELIKRIRESETFKDIIIIVSSASVFETDRYRSIEAGGNYFLPKPIQATELLQTLQKYLNLEWLYEAHESLLSIEADSNELIAPPATELETLYELAMKGNFREIVKQAALLEETDSKYIPFAKKLHQMAKDFQDEEIITFIQTYK